MFTWSVFCSALKIDRKLKNLEVFYIAHMRTNVNEHYGSNVVTLLKKVLT